MLAEFLAEQLFGRWSLVLHYDLGRGLRAFAGRDEQRLKDMVALANKKVGDLSALPKDPAATFALLDRFVRNNIMAAEEDRLSLAVIMDQASYVFPVRRARPPEHAGLVAARDDAELGDEPAREAAQHGVRDGGREARRPQRSAHRQPARRDDRGAAAGREGAAGIHQRVGGHHGARRTSRISTPRSWRRSPPASRSPTSTCSSSRRARAASGSTPQCSASLKKRLLERQCHGLLEFIEPRWTLDTVVGHEAAKARLREDAALLKRGALDSLPMGYLLCGPVGTGKSFLAQCVSGEIGVPCVDAQELPLEVRRGDGRQSGARAGGAARDGTGGRRRRRGGCGARQPRAGRRFGNVEPRVRA